MAREIDFSCRGPASMPRLSLSMVSVPGLVGLAGIFSGLAPAPRLGQVAPIVGGYSYGEGPRDSHGGMAMESTQNLPASSLWRQEVATRAEELESLLDAYNASEKLSSTQ